jgi:serine/threonine protein kinase
MEKKSVMPEVASVFSSFDLTKLTIKEISTNGGKESIRIYETCIGKGIVSSIHLGIHCSGTHVAMKVYPKNWAIKHAAIIETEKKFFYELGNETNIGPKMIFHPMKTSNFIYFPLEFYNCGSLLDNMHPELQFPVGIIQKIGLFLANSLKFLHERRLLHGSIRPSHVLIRLEDEKEATFRLSGFKSIVDKKPAEPDNEAFYPDVSALGLLLYDIAMGANHEKVSPNFVEEFKKTGKLPLPNGPNRMDPTLDDLIRKLLTCINGKIMLASAIPDHPFFKLSVAAVAIKDFFTSPKIEFTTTFKKYKASNKDIELEELPEYSDLKEYELGDMISEAPFTKSYECKKKGKTYNVQVVSPEITDEGFKNIIDEINLHRKLKNIPTTLEYIDYFTINNRLYIVTEPSTEKTLNEYVKDKVTGEEYKLTADDINTIVINLSLGIRAMHENNMALRDLRPSNFLVVLNEDGTIKALKLKFLGHIFIGADTIDFIAPEIVLKKVQVNALNFKQMQKIDTWGFGELLHFICYGKPLYTSHEECKNYIANPDNFPAYSNEYSKELHKIMCQCLKPDSNNRPEILELLKNPYFSTGFPVLPEGLIPFTLGKRISRHTNVPTMICECYDEDGNKFLMKMVNYVNLSLSEDKVKIDCEISIMKSLSDMKVLHVSKMHAHFLVNGIFYLVLEYANGGDLYGYIKDRVAKSNPLSVEEQELIIQDILETMVILHYKGIIHGDLHPKNILVCVDAETQSIIKEVKLGDFGFAQLLTDKSDHKRTPELKSFVSPEMFKDPSEIDHKVADVWALGMIIFFVLYGFEASEYFVSSDMRSDKPLSFPKEIYKSSNRLKQAMMMCLDKKLDSKLSMERLEQLLFKKTLVSH